MSSAARSRAVWYKCSDVSADKENKRCKLETLLETRLRKQNAEGISVNAGGTVQ